MVRILNLIGLDAAIMMRFLRILGDDFDYSMLENTKIYCVMKIHLGYI